MRFRAAGTENLWNLMLKCVFGQAKHNPIYVLRSLLSHFQTGNGMCFAYLHRLGLTKSAKLCPLT